MLEKINAFEPDALFVGMTAPKQEKWAYEHFTHLQAGHICCIGAVFDFYAGTISRAPQWMIQMGLEWLYRLIKEPRRMWRRYLIGNSKFIWAVVKEKYNSPSARTRIKKNKRNTDDRIRTLIKKIKGTLIKKNKKNTDDTDRTDQH